VKPESEWPATHVEMVPVDKLVPYARNARTHTPEQVDQIAASIVEFGWTMPVLIDPEGVLIAGHGRVMAAHKLGLARVPASVATTWTAAQIKAHRLTDNKLALNAGWNEELLAIELSELQGFDFNTALTGFSIGEVESIMGGTAPSLDELEQSAGEGAEDDLWPSVKLLVPPDVKQRFDELMKLTGAAEDWSKLDSILTAAEPALRERLS
jgi:ParB-like chromosome segregation protein Spo0J